MKEETLKETANTENADTLTPVSNVDVSINDVLKGKVRRRKKKGKGKGDGPRHPLTGYIRFMNVRRDELRILHPNATAIDLTKIIGVEWTQLSDEKKQPFLAAAEIDRERFNQEVRLYKKMKAEEAAEDEKIKKPVSAANGPIKLEKPVSITTSTPIAIKEPIVLAELPTISTIPVPPPIVNKILPQRTGEYDIPIFTEEFLENNKSVDSELRMLRKSNTDYEQQNAVLEKHVENMTNGVKKLQDDKIALRSSNDVLQVYIDRMREKLSGALSTLAIPSESQGASVENINKYMADLQHMANSNSHGPASLNKAKDIIRKLNLHIQL